MSYLCDCFLRKPIYYGVGWSSRERDRERAKKKQEAETEEDEEIERGAHGPRSYNWALLFAIWPTVLLKIAACEARHIFPSSQGDEKKAQKPEQSWSYSVCSCRHMCDYWFPFWALLLLLSSMYYRNGAFFHCRRVFAIITTTVLPEPGPRPRTVYVAEGRRTCKTILVNVRPLLKYQTQNKHGLDNGHRACGTDSREPRISTPPPNRAMPRHRARDVFKYAMRVYSINRYINACHRQTTERIRRKRIGWNKRKERIATQIKFHIRYLPDKESRRPRILLQNKLGDYLDIKHLSWVLDNARG